MNVFMYVLILFSYYNNSCFEIQFDKLQKTNVDYIP